MQLLTVMLSTSPTSDNNIATVHGNLLVLNNLSSSVVIKCIVESLNVMFHLIGRYGKLKLKLLPRISFSLCVKGCFPVFWKSLE